MQRPNPIKGFKDYIHRRGHPSREPAISEVVREPTAGGIIYRRRPQGEVEILLIQDAKDRWTIPKGHIEEGESSKQTAEREVREETGLQEMRVQSYLGKIHFRYRRQQTLVLMTTHIHLIEARGDTDDLKKEDWMNGIKWMPASEAFDKIAYEDIGKLILLALKQIRERGNYQPKPRNN